MLRLVFSLRFRVVLLVLLAVLPALGLTLYTGLEQRRLAAAGAQNDALRLTRLAAGNQERLIEGARQLLVAFAQLPQVRQADSAACNALFADLLKQYPFYSGFAVAKANGDVICSAPPLTQPVSIADRGYFQRLVQTRDFVTGEYQIGRISGKAVIVSAYPVLDAAGQMQAVVSAGLDLAWLNQLAAEAQLPEGSALTVSDRDGTILARYPEPEKWVGKTLPEAPIIQAILAQQGEGTAEAIGVDNVMRLYAFTPLSGGPEAGAYVSVGIPTAVAFAEADQTLTRNLAGLGLVAVLALAAAWVGGDVFVVRRVNTLVNATKRLATGNLSARIRPRYGVGELSQLARAFDQMAEALEQREDERRRAEEALRHRAEQLAALHATLLDITVQHSLPTLLRAIVERAVRLLDGASGGLYLCDADRQEVRCVVSYNIPRDYTGTILKYGEGAAGTVAATGTPLIIDDYRGWPGRAAAYEEDQPFTAVISAPMMWQRQVTGVIHVLRDVETRHFRQDDLELLILFANQAAIAVENARLLEAERHARQTAETLRAANVALTGSLDLNSVLDTLLTYLGRLVPYDTANVMLLEEDSRFVLRADRGYERWMDPQKVRAITFDVQASPHLQRILSTQQTVIIPDTARHSGWQRVAGAEHVRNWMGVPLITGGRVIGLFSLDKTEPDCFTHEHLRLAEALAAQAAVAIQNARLHAQAQLHANELEQRVAQRTRELAQANERLTELDRLKSKFVSDVSHELRTPVTNLKLYVELLERGKSEKRDYYMTTLKQQANRLVQLVEDILNLSRLELGAGKAQFAPVDLNALVEQVVNAHRPSADSAGLRLTFVPGPDLRPIRGERNQLAQVVTNLVANAINYTPVGEVRVSTYWWDEQVCLEVYDTGIGIDPEDVPHLFERFYRGKHADRADIPGSGLGLAIVKEIVDLHTGRIEVESRAGEGSTFRVRLPIDQSRA